MKFSKSIKLLLGAATGFYALAPFLFGGFYFLWMFAMIPVFSSAEQGPTMQFPVVPFLLIFAIFFVVIMFFNLLHLTLIPVYVTLLIKNKTGLDILRIIIAVGLFFLPFIAMPAYFLIYILPAAVPDWALEPNRAPAASVPANAN